MVKILSFFDEKTKDLIQGDSVVVAMDGDIFNTDVYMDAIVIPIKSVEDFRYDSNLLWRIEELRGKSVIDAVKSRFGFETFKTNQTLIIKKEEMILKDGNFGDIIFVAKAKKITEFPTATALLAAVKKGYKNIAVIANDFSAPIDDMELCNFFIFLDKVQIIEFLIKKNYKTNVNLYVVVYNNPEYTKLL